MNPPDDISLIAGCGSEEANLLLARQIVSAVEGEPIETDEAYPAEIIAAVIMGRLKPRSELEGMLAAQMVSLHFAAMDDFAKAKQCEAEDIRERLRADAAEKCKVFAMSVEALAKARSFREGLACP